MIKREARRAVERALWRAEQRERFEQLLAQRHIVLLNGTTIDLPKDVRILDIRDPLVQCAVGAPIEYCNERPHYLLGKGDTRVWVDGHATAFAFESGEFRPEDFPFVERE